MNENLLTENQNLITEKFEETAKSAMKLNIEYIWRELSVTPKKANTKNNQVAAAKPKKILENVYGKVQTGEALAILGSSGAGKTTLLNFLSKKNQSPNLKIEGEILINNKPASESLLNSISSYVMQDDVLQSTLTPTEILLFTAKMKLKNNSDKEIEEEVHEMVKKLNLENCKDTKIGDEITRGVSGGERKRTSIAVELISDPQIVFLDEPTTGLDSFNAYEVVKNICNLAKIDNKLIIFTIHQPSSEIFELLDKICILADGKTIYFGSRKDCLECFKEIFNLPCPQQYNPFEHFMDMTTMECIFNKQVRQSYPELSFSHDDSDEIKFEAYSDHMGNLSQIFKRNKEKYISSETNFDGFSNEMEELIQIKKGSRGLCYQYSSLLGRNLIISQRNKKLLAFKIFQNLFTSFLQSLLYYHLSQNFSGIQDRLGIIFLCVTSGVFGTSTSSLLIFAEEKKIYLREQANKLYSIPAYFLAKLTCEIPIFFITTNCLVTLIYILSNLNDTYSYKFYFYNAVVQLACFTGLSYSIFLGSLVTNRDALTNFNTVFLIPQMLLSGFFASSSNYVIYLKPFEFISGFKYAYQCLSQLEFSDIQPLNCINGMGEACDVLNGRLKFDESFSRSLITLLLLAICFLLVSLSILLFKGRTKS